MRYDFSTATKLLDANQELKRRYGTLTELLAQARTAQELSARLQEFKHIGPVTARIFIIGTVSTLVVPAGLRARNNALPSLAVS